MGEGGRGGHVVALGILPTAVGVGKFVGGGRGLRYHALRAAGRRPNGWRRRRCSL